MGGVADLAVEGDDVFPGATESLEGSAVGPTGRLLGPDLPGRQIQSTRQARGEVLARAWVGLAHRDDHGRSAGLLEGLRVGPVDLLGVVAVDLDRVPAEGLGAGDVVVAVPAVHRLPGLAEAVHVKDGYEVVELVVRGVL